MRSRTGREKRKRLKKRELGGGGLGRGLVRISPGHDGEYGTIRLFDEPGAEDDAAQLTLF